MAEGRSYDAIVVGLGAHGSAAAAELARRGARVLGMERFERGHEMGSSVGRSRVIRLAYFEHPDYVPLLRRAWDRWGELERESAERLLYRTGGLYVGPRGSPIVEGSLASARQHGLAHDELGTDELRARFPWVRADEGMVALFEEQAGYLVPERCIAAHLRLAEDHGAVLRFSDGAVDWYPDGSGFAVHTASGIKERGERLVLATGAWLGYFLPDLALPLSVERVPLFWFEPTRPDLFADIPVYIVDTDDGGFYGFPYLPDQGLKVARHGTGAFLSDPGARAPAREAPRRRPQEPGTWRTGSARVDADHLDRAIHPGEDDRVRRFVRRYLPDGDGPLREAKVCMYTKTPDEHFIVDRHPLYPGVVFASACSGHGFKFASVVGEVLADLALTGKTALPIGFLSLDRPL